MPIMEYQICKDFVVQASFFSLGEVNFDVNITLPEGTTLVSARAEIAAHGEMLGLYMIPLPYGTWTIYVYLNDNNVYYDYGFTCQTKTGETDVTPYIAPRTGGSATNCFTVRVVNVSPYVTLVRVKFSILLIIEYSGEPPTLAPPTYTTTTQAIGPGGVANFIQTIVSIIEILPLIITLYFVSSIMSAIRDILPKGREKGEK